MKKGLGALPVPLQRQVLARVGLSAAAAAAGAGLLVLLRSAAMAAPCLAVELLAPAGSPEALTAAVHGGAGTVYLGFGPLNARRNAKNFTREELEAGVAVEVYITDTTPLYDWRGIHQLQSYLALVAGDAPIGG